MKLADILEIVREGKQIVRINFFNLDVEASLLTFFFSPANRSYLRRTSCHIELHITNLRTGSVPHWASFNIRQNM